ncbi:AMP-binding protein [Marinivivus vitaminiproducens]|uniref:AMP-binding protein n=1 Tax=Marinivivus vitaminiproducens TaxID=3035935 RepID=UPI0027A28440|nr:AMP-binding protein [Geminicoccaceae bacterium SCSIO 64248]
MPSDLPTLQHLLGRIVGQGDRPALVALERSGRREWSYVALAEHAERVARGLLADGLEAGQPVGIYGANRPEWVAVLLGIVAAGGVAMPLNHGLGADELERLVEASGLTRLFTTKEHLKSIAALGEKASFPVFRLDVDEGEGNAEGLAWRSWTALAGEDAGDLPPVEPDAPAALLYTSGTTGTPKGALLTHGNLARNVDAVVAAELATADDRAVLPLPMHHAYPLTVGLLVPLALGATIILPAGVTGQQVSRALVEEKATILFGVPRLYIALVAAMDSQLAQRGIAGRALRRVWDLSTELRRRFGWLAGPVLMKPLRARLGPELRMMVSGGSRLDPDLARRLEGLGYVVLTGYGLSETSPILTFNRPGRARLESTGEPVPDVELRIAKPEGDAADGEVQARGPSVFGGYWKNAEATKATFTEDGWFKTGDLGRIDADGYLQIVGRSKELIVLSGGKNVQPEDVEAAFTGSSLIKEAATYEDDGKLGLLVVPDAQAARGHEADALDALIRKEVGERSQRLPSYERPSEVLVTRETLPRTQIGKLRRHEIGPIVDAARSGERRAPPSPARTAEDEALLQTEPAGPVFGWLQERFQGQPLTLDSGLQVDLGLDSFDWMSLTLELEERFQVRLSEEQVGEVQTIRDLLQAANEAPAATEANELSEEKRRWLDPRGPVLTALAFIAYALDWLIMRLVFRLKVEGQEHLPAEGPFLLTPNHVSYLDPPVLAAALPTHIVRRVVWAGWTGVMFNTAPMRLVSRICRVVPVDAERGVTTTLLYGRAVVERGEVLVWFPEGQRSPKGDLLRFLPGVGLLMLREKVPAVPVLITGAHEALPPDRSWPRFTKITVRFGPPQEADALAALADGGSDDREEAKVATGLRSKVEALGR